MAAVERHAKLEFVNGGGTGSVAATAADPTVTEVTAGSGLYGPALFDHYRAFAPATGGAVRAAGGPSAGTGRGRPWPAAAGSPPVPRTPAGHRCRGCRPGLRLTATEGAGEVQTPLVGAAAADLVPGDRVWFRHAKAGELCERVDRLHLLAGDEVVGAAPTYRGEGRTFL